MGRHFDPEVEFGWTPCPDCGCFSWHMHYADDVRVYECDGCCATVVCHDLHACHNWCGPW